MDTLRQWRRRKGWTQADLAREAGVHLETVSGIETGNHEPRPSTLQKLAGALGVEVEELFDSPKARAPTSLPKEADEERRAAEGYDDLLDPSTRLFHIKSAGPLGRPFKFEEIVSALEQAGISEAKAADVLKVLVEGR